MFSLLTDFHFIR